jgi:hypothetical protein
LIAEVKSERISLKKAQVANLWRNQLNLEITLIPRIGRKRNERINHYDQ